MKGRVLARAGYFVGSRGLHFLHDRQLCRLTSRRFRFGWVHDDRCNRCRALTFALSNTTNIPNALSAHRSASTSR